ncbi:hypothetical protein PRZ48_001196 [Zasmidium cellare]|uniref:Alpha/beta hydrolase fold-3 domain-containing protein n=1 Tax=Zasmidium cellare TaxID=395010 RepID=A0ABR0F254_ZASCE|nr:hypothetical protein PRZ48_001196 [Zasmidium cellare]
MDLMSKGTLQMIGDAEPAITEEYKDIPMRDGYKSTIKIHRPTNPPASGSPVIVYYFGGGFIGGDMHQATAPARAWIRLFGATVIVPSYRLAPEHKFPISQNDAWDSFKWVDEHAHELGADPKLGFIVAGASAGGVCASAIATHAIENPLKNPITGQYLCVPSIMDKEGCPDKFKPYYLALEHNKDAPILSADSMRSITDHTGADPKSPWRHPVYSKAPLSKQPPAYFQVDGMDPLRDDGLIWDEMLKEAGVKTKIDFYPGCPHAHFGFFPGIGVTIKGVGDQMVGVGWLLGKEITAEQGLGGLMPQAAA